ncbi:hypothetical protein Tco_1555711 [Tanacetum coccineum]
MPGGRSAQGWYCSNTHNRNDHYHHDDSSRRDNRDGDTITGRFEGRRQEVNQLSLEALIKKPKEILATERQLQLPPCPPMIGTPKKENLDRSEGKKRKYHQKQGEDWMNVPVTFPPMQPNDVSNEPLIVEAEVEGYLVRRIFVDQGAAVQVIHLPVPSRIKQNHSLNVTHEYYPVAHKLRILGAKRIKALIRRRYENGSRQWHCKCRYDIRRDFQSGLVEKVDGTVEECAKTKNDKFGMVHEGLLPLPEIDLTIEAVWESPTKDCGDTLRLILSGDNRSTHQTNTQQAGNVQKAGQVRSRAEDIQHYIYTTKRDQGSNTDRFLERNTSRPSLWPHEGIARNLAKSKELTTLFSKFSIENIPQNQNQKADVLSKLASVAFNHLTKELLVEVLNKKSVEAKEISAYVRVKENCKLHNKNKARRGCGNASGALSDGGKDHATGVLLANSIPRRHIRERRETATIREAKYKKKVEQYYNKRVWPMSFKVGDFVYMRNEASCVENQGKLGPNWEGPYRVIKA